MKMIYGLLLAAVLALPATDTLATETMTVTMTSCNTVTRICTHTVTIYTRDLLTGKWHITSIRTFTTPMPYSDDEAPIQ